MRNAGGDTRRTIFSAAMQLFAEKGYNSVPVREIADRVGIRPASIYNHFESKEAILTEIYRYFDNGMEAQRPDLDRLLALAETEHPHEVMRQTSFIFPSDKTRLMAQAMRVTSSMMGFDQRADELLSKNLVEMVYGYDPPILQRMVALGRIEPMDVQGFTLLHSCYNHSTAVRFFTDHALDTGDWLKGLDLLFAMLKVTEAAQAP